MPEKKYSLLLVDDDTATLRALERVLRSQFNCYAFTNPVEALNHLSEIRPSIIIADGSMPEMSGIEFLEQCRLRSPAAVRVLLSGQIEMDSISEHLQSGLLHRFFMKPWDNQVLKLQIIECQGLHQSILEKLQLEQLALRDPLTGAYNRRSFEETMNIEISRSQREQTPLSLLFLDIDDFKKFNDRQGHPRGDQALKDLVKSLKEKLRPTDSIFRIGGDEFAILLPKTSASLALEVCNRLRHQTENIYQGPEKITMSIGVSCFPEISTTSTDLIKTSDQALYEAKNRGRNQTIVATKN
jgi:diguanylate cyclase (GGDEF)-like protein